MATTVQNAQDIKAVYPKKKRGAENLTLQSARCRAHGSYMRWCKRLRNGILSDKVNKNEDAESLAALQCVGYVLCRLLCVKYLRYKIPWDSINFTVSGINAGSHISKKLLERVLKKRNMIADYVIQCTNKKRSHDRLTLLNCKISLPIWESFEMNGTTIFPD